MKTPTDCWLYPRHPRVTIQRIDQPDLKRCLAEAVKLEQTSHGHPNVVKLLTFYFDATTPRLFIVTEFCDGGNLESIINVRGFRSLLLSSERCITMILFSLLGCCRGDIQRVSHLGCDGRHYGRPGILAQTGHSSWGPQAC